jgi:hypothetical protein
MDNAERQEFLKGKPTYSCRFHPTDWWHEVGCSHRIWSATELQSALDKAKRSNELVLKLKNDELYRSPQN